MDCSMLSDEELLIGYVGSTDVDLFDELVSRYQTELLWFLVGCVGRDFADDVFQEVWLTLHLKCGLFVEGRRFRPWFFTMASNKAIDRLRREGRQWVVSYDTGEESYSGLSRDGFVDLVAVDPLDAAITSERRDEIRDKLSKLPDLQRECVELYYFDGLKYHEIGELIGVPLGTIKSRMFKAMEGLRRAG